MNLKKNRATDYEYKVKRLQKLDVSFKEYIECLISCSWKRYKYRRKYKLDAYNSYCVYLGYKKVYKNMKHLHNKKLSEIVKICGAYIPQLHLTYMEIIKKLNMSLCSPTKREREDFIKIQFKGVEK